MDLNNRSFRPAGQVNAQNNDEPQPAHSAHGGSDGHKKGGKLNRFKTGGVLNVTYVFLLFSVTIVIVGVILSLVMFKNTSGEEKFVDKAKYQAVFLNNGQVYFGHVNDLSKDYLTLSDIYYLRVNQQVQPDRQASQNDVSLVKLGCELHGPQDSMTVNRDQITFWENLKDDGQVAKAVAEYKKANPNGQNCEQQAQQNQNSNTNNSSNNNANEDNNSTNNSTDTNDDSTNNNSTDSTPTNR